MQSIINLARGSVRAEIQGAYPERFMNICAENDIGFWDLEHVDEVTLRVTMTIGDYKKMRRFLNNIMCTAKTIKKSGAPFLLWRIRKRYALILGLIAVVALTWVMSLYIWDISVTGNDRVSATEILEVLSLNGVGVGTYSPSIDSESLRNQVLLELDELSWITIHVNGSKATVVVRERVETPDLLQEDRPGNIIAAKSGIIEEMIVFDGVSIRAKGDSVSEGDEIVSGAIDSLASGMRFVNARGEIYARTWYEYTMTMPVEYAKKTYTGSSSTKSAIIFGGNRINLYINSGNSYEDYDKITSEKFLTLAGGVVLPVKIATSTYVQYTAETTDISEDAAVEILKERLLYRLEENLEENGKIIKTEFDATTGQGVVTVRLTAECREQIGISRALTEDEMTAEQDTQEQTGETDAND